MANDAKTQPPPADYLDRLDEGILSVYTDNLLDGVNEEDNAVNGNGFLASMTFKHIVNG